MTTDDNRTSYVRYLHKVKDKGQVQPGFDEIITIIANEARVNGLENEDINLIADVLKNVHFSASKSSTLIKCMIPKYRISNNLLKNIVLWYINSLQNGQVSILILLLQWIIGALEYDVVDRTTVNVFYEIFFNHLLQKARLEVYLAQIIYELTEPEDVTRLHVTYLLNLQKNYKKPQKHLTALLSLFKSYKPELVPEKISAIGIGSVWKALPNEFLHGFADAKSRAALQETSQKTSQNFKWCTTTGSGSGRRKESILPSVEYFNIGSRVFKEKSTTSIFDVCNVEALGKYQINVELPCNATSLLTNTAGYHLLMFADISYQNRFSYNLYITLRRAFLFEPEKYPKQELARLLDMTYEFLRYLQHGIPVVTRFLHDYFLYRMTTEHQSKLLALTQWIPLSFTVDELEEYVLKHLRFMFFESSLQEKFEIIRTLRLMLLNICVNHYCGKSLKNSESPFLDQKCTINIKEMVSTITKFAQSLIFSGYNNYSNSSSFMSEALLFYEQMCVTENLFSMRTWTIAPTNIIYGSFLNRNCLILSRVCSLLINYRERSQYFSKKNLKENFPEEFNKLDLHAYDLINALWEGKSFSNRQQGGKFLKSLSDRVIEKLSINVFDEMLCLNHHYATFPYKITFSVSGLEIESREDLFKVAVHFFPEISEFLRIEIGLETVEGEEV
ncbi:uncharacterized protein LOC122499371 [Leptopilina heterotoma]|uniref:uncharacterized protein LOC122499371 n=1 Tax=Leptopilina heterotoma TaxID=63436 RepID=UPI001CA93A9F|nr:uncharacterized protein LOC122499371 [Leptopilina heterotoma]